MRKEVRSFEKYLHDETIIKESSIRQYVSQVNAHYNVLEKFLELKDISIINKLLVKEFRKKNSNTKKASFVHFLRFSELARFIPELIPLKNKPKKKMPNWFSMDEINELLTHLGKTTRLIIDLQHETGVRIREVLTLKKNHVKIDNTDQCKIMIYTKTNQALIKKISRDHYDRLMKIPVKSNKEFLFIKDPSNNPKEFETQIRSRYNRISEEFRDVAFKVFGKKANTHDIRRSMAEYIVRKNPTIQGLYDAQQFLGHSNVKTTFAYLNNLGIMQDMVKKDDSN